MRFKLLSCDVLTREVNIAWQEFHDKKDAEKAAA